MCEGKPGTVRLGKDIAARVRSEHCACHRPSIIISRVAFIENSLKLMLEGIHLPPTPLVCCEDLGDDLQGQALPQVGGQCEWGRQLSCWCRRCFSIRSCLVLEVVPFFGCFKHVYISNIIIIELNQIMPKDANEKSEAFGSTQLAQEQCWLAFALGRQLALPRQLARQHQR